MCRDGEADSVMAAEELEPVVILLFLDSHCTCGLLLGLMPAVLPLAVSGCLDKHVVLLVHPRDLALSAFELKVLTRGSSFARSREFS